MSSPFPRLAEHATIWGHNSLIGAPDAPEGPSLRLSPDASAGEQYGTALACRHDAVSPAAERRQTLACPASRGIAGGVHPSTHTARVLNNFNPIQFNKDLDGEHSLKSLDEYAARPFS